MPFLPPPPDTLKANHLPTDNIFKDVLLNKQNTKSPSPKNIFSRDWWVISTTRGKPTFTYRNNQTIT